MFHVKHPQSILCESCPLQYKKAPRPLFWNRGRQWIRFFLFKSVVVSAGAMAQTPRIAASTGSMARRGIIAAAAMVPLLPAVTAAGDSFLADCVTGAVETMLMVQRTVHILAVGMVPVAASMGTVLMVQGAVRFQTMAVVQSAAGMDTMLMIQSTVGQAVVMI